MRLDSEGLRELYQGETARSARRSADNCPREDMLARAASGQLQQPDREHVADHLVTCSDCAKEYLAIKSLKTWTDEASANDGAPATALPVSENGKHYAIAVDPQVTRFHSRRLSVYFPYALAAAALLLSLALGALVISKSRENQRLIAEANNRQADTKAAEELAQARRLLDESNRRAQEESAARRVAEEDLARRNAAQKQRPASPERSAPDVNVPLIDLNPQDAGRGSQNQKATTIELPPHTNLFTLILNLGSSDSSATSDSYSLEVMDRNNKAIWTSSDLRKSPYNNFTVAMRRSSFPGGEYRLKIYGLRDGRRELIEEYAVRLLYR